MNKQSLELCTETLGSETGSDGLSSAEEFFNFFSLFCSKRDSFEEKLGEKKHRRRKELTAMKQCSFPPPLPSAFIQMRSFRCDGHLILKAFFVSSHNYLRAERHCGRLVLSFLSRLVEEDNDDDDDGEEEGEEEEIQVVDREAMVLQRPKFFCHAPLANADETYLTTDGGSRGGGESYCMK